jgi:hypothetical protein
VSVARASFSECDGRQRHAATWFSLDRTPTLAFWEKTEAARQSLALLGNGHVDWTDDEALEARQMMVHPVASGRLSRTDTRHLEGCITVF